MIRFPIIFQILVLGALAILSTGCEDGIVASSVQIHITAGLDGRVYVGDPLVLSLTGLPPKEFPVVIDVGIPSNDPPLMASSAMLTADVDGKITNAILGYNLGFGQQNDPENCFTSFGMYTITIFTSKGRTERTFTIPGSPNRTTVHACNSSGTLLTGVETGQPVYVWGAKLSAGVKYRVYPVADRMSWSDGDTFAGWKVTNSTVPDDLPNYIEVTCDANGDLQPTRLLPYTTRQVPGVTDQFDIVLDAPPYEVFSSVTDAVDGKIPTGVVVQDPKQDGPIVANLACRADYSYGVVFNQSDPVYVRLNPAIKLDDTYLNALVFIINHDDNLADGAQLMDVSGNRTYRWPPGSMMPERPGAPETVYLEPGCLNLAPVLVWPDSKVGKYDVVLDMNGNYVYDEGIDILDGGASGPGFEVKEFKIPY